MEVTVEMYVVELYRDSLVDLLLLEEDDDTTHPPALEIKKDAQGVVYVRNVTTRVVRSEDELLQLVSLANARRKVACTEMNSESSRGHLLVSLVLLATNTKTGLGSRGKLTLVDLAGSERQDKTGATGDTALEARSINKSLSALSNVIAALTSGAKHVLQH